MLIEPKSDKNGIITGFVIIIPEMVLDRDDAEDLAYDLEHALNRVKELTSLYKGFHEDNYWCQDKP